MPSDQSRIIEQATFTYSPIRKTLEKQTKTIEEQGEKLIKANENRVEKKSVASLFSENVLNEEATSKDIFELNKNVGYRK